MNDKYLHLIEELEKLNRLNNLKIIKNTTVFAYMHTNYLIVSNAGGTEDLLKAAADGAVELYYDGTLQTKTTSTGLHLADSKRIDFGTGSDLRIYHDGSNSYIADEGTGDIVISSGTITFKNQARDETHANFIGNGAVELYHNNVKKFETTSGGVEISGIPKIKYTINIIFSCPIILLP